MTTSSKVMRKIVFFLIYDDNGKADNDEKNDFEKLPARLKL